MVTIHPANADDFSSLGYGALEPATLEIEERARGMYELCMTHPMDERGKWWNIAEHRIIKAPAPVRETPLVEMGHASTTVVRKVYQVRVNSHLRLRTAPSTSTGKIIGRYKNGTKVTQIDVSGAWYKVIVQEGGATGWMHSDYLRYVGDQTETVVGDAPGVVIQPRQTREQLFRIRTVERDDDAAMVTVTAQHIFYDLAGNIVKDDYAPEDVEAAEVCTQLSARAMNPHSFQFVCTAGGRVSGEYGGKSIVSCLLEKEIGVATQTGARVIRDNFDVFLLADETRDRGVTIRHGKNMVGAVLTVDTSSMVTRIQPVGKNKDGDPLYLEGDGYVDSPRAASIPVIRAKRVEYDVSVVEKKADANADEGKYATEGEARARLRELANAEFEAGIDGVTVGLDIDFVALENTAQYAQYAGLQSIHMYDTVHVYAPRSEINAALRMTGYVWDGMANGGKGRYKSVTLGQLEDIQLTTYGYDIADGTLSGTKVINGSIGGDKIRNASIEYAKISVAAIETLAANSITALSAHINDLVAGRIEVNQLYADLVSIAIAQISTANIDHANIQWAAISSLTTKIAEIAAAQITTTNIDYANIQWAEIASLTARIGQIAEAKISKATITTAQISDLQAEIAKVITLAAQDGKFDFASIKDLLAQAMIIEEGVAGSVYIQNLVATQANILGATLGELVLQGADGNYYNITVQSDGTIRTEQVTVTSGEIAAGQTSGGKQIVATTANVDALNATDIKAQSAIISSIFTGALEAGKISAQEAFLASATVPELRVTALKALGDTLDISANEQIKLLVSNISNVNDRVSTAEQKITSDAIVSTVRNSKSYKDDLAAKADTSILNSYAKSSDLIQTAENIRLEVSSIRIGGKNLLRLGGLTYPYVSLYPNGTISSVGATGYYYEGGYHISILPFITEHAEIKFTYPLSLTPGQYVLSFWAWTYEVNQVISFRPNLYCDGTGDDSYLDHYFTDFLYPQANVPKWYEITVTIDYSQHVNLRFVCQTQFSTGTLYFSDVKFEQGNKATGWTPAPEDPVSSLQTSSITIRDKSIEMDTGGNIHLRAGAGLIVDSGAVNISTSDFRLSVQKQNDAENEVINIDPNYGRITVDELISGNMRPYTDYMELWLSQIGSIREFANILQNNTFGRILLHYDKDEYGNVPVDFDFVQANRIDIVADNGYRHTIPWNIKYCSAQILAINLVWDCGNDVDAITMHSGDILLYSCCIVSAKIGLMCYELSRASWAGLAYYQDGYCSDVFAEAADASDVAIYGHIPGDAKSSSLLVVAAARGLTRDLTIHSSQGTPALQYQSSALSGLLGWISTKHGWTTGIAYQGYTTGKGECYACIKFDLPAMALVIGATLSLRRKSGVGKGAPVDVHVYGSATDWGSRPTLGTMYAAQIDAVSGGKTISIDIKEAIEALRTGDIKQIVLYEGDGNMLNNNVYSTDYCAWDMATLDVTYTN